jgi:hypothetical protein
MGIGALGPECNLQGARILAQDTGMEAVSRSVSFSLEVIRP